MSTAFILVFLTMLLPLLSYLGSLSRVPRLDNAISLSNVAIALFLYEFIPLSGTFYVDFTTWVFILMVTSIHLLSQVYSKSYFRKQEIWIGENLFNLLLALFTTSTDDMTTRASTSRNTLASMRRGMGRRNTAKSTMAFSSSMYPIIWA